jgi:hypothetical protein
MAAQQHKPVWINLEYLSAEDWVEGCHKLPSPHPSLPLVKYFFFPGFTPKTGGLLLERDLLARRDAFQSDPQAIAAYWKSLDISAPQTDETRVSLFCYENPALPGFLAAWAEGNAPILCLVPEGRAMPQVAAFFGQAQAAPGDVFRRGNLEVRVLPFVEQERYDELLWACDINLCAARIPACGHSGRASPSSGTSTRSMTAYTCKSCAPSWRCIAPDCHRMRRRCCMCCGRRGMGGQTQGRHGTTSGGTGLFCGNMPMIGHKNFPVTASH